MNLTFLFSQKHALKVRWSKLLVDIFPLDKKTSEKNREGAASFAAKSNFVDNLKKFAFDTFDRVISLSNKPL